MSELINAVHHITNGFFNVAGMILALAMIAGVSWLSRMRTRE
jgi:hypothetical protein